MTDCLDKLHDQPFYADCPHCARYEFKDEDAWFEHVSMCEFEQQMRELEEEE